MKRQLAKENAELGLEDEVDEVAEDLHGVFGDASIPVIVEDDTSRAEVPLVPERVDANDAVSEFDELSIHDKASTTPEVTSLSQSTCGAFTPNAEADSLVSDNDSQALPSSSKLPSTAKKLPQPEMSKKEKRRAREATKKAKEAEFTNSAGSAQASYVGMPFIVHL